MHLGRLLPQSAAGRTAAFTVALAVTAGGGLVATGAVGLPTGKAPAKASTVAIARGGGSGGATDATAVSGSDIRLAGYDAARHTAVLTVGKQDKAPRAGDVIASPATAQAPHGALFKVATATTSGNQVKVTTKPATLSDALGATTVKRTLDAPALDMSVTPLVPGLKVRDSADQLPGGTASPSAGSDLPAPTSSSRPTPATPDGSATASTPGDPSSDSPSPSSSGTPGTGTTATPITRPTRMDDGGIILSADIPLTGLTGVTGTGSSAPKLAVWAGLTPKLIFSYGQKDADGAKPYQAEIGVGGTYQYGWQLHAKLAGLADTGELTALPFAQVHLKSLFWIGPVPIVIGVDLTYFYRLTADGNLSIDSEQSTKGDFTLGGQYDSRTGWNALNQNQASTLHSATDALTGHGDFRATVGADLAVMLYDTVGLSGRLAPYVRAVVDADTASALLQFFAGVDVTGALNLRLSILGIPILKADLPIGTAHSEWPIATEPLTLSTPDTPTPTSSEPDPSTPVPADPSDTDQDSPGGA